VAVSAFDKRLLLRFHWQFNLFAGWTAASLIRNIKIIHRGERETAPGSKEEKAIMDYLECQHEKM
jgi:hypothetical protein